jgi:hypothetical protein
MFQQLPVEINSLIFGYANMRCHSGKVSNLFHPNDARLAMIQTQLEKYKKSRNEVLLDYRYKICMILRVTTFKYILLNKFTGLIRPDYKERTTTQNVVYNNERIKYQIMTIFTYRDEILTMDQVYPLHTETVFIP